MPQLCIIKFDAMLQLKNSKNKISNVHKVFITDEDCIFDALKQIVDELVLNPNPCLSLVYANSNKYPQHIFDQGVSFLEKRFPEKLLIYKAPICKGTVCIGVEFLKPLIKSNSSEEMKFFLYGKSQFVYSLSNTLIFLGIKSVIITKPSNTNCDEN